MASIAEFYSHNLATEVMKGTLQKAKNEGTPSMAPIGYLNVHNLVNGVPIRTVELDLERAPLVTWAFEAYATGEWSLGKLADELQNRGLTQRAGRTRPERPYPATRLHQMLQNRYYLGYVRYQGLEYEGKHPALVSPDVFEAVQAVLAAHRQGGERAYRYTHYLKGTLRCGRCRSRLAYSCSRGNGGTYDYYFCLGRHERRTNCDMPHLDPTRHRTGGRAVLGA
jgi:site-specific DNA recombinase